ncbi:MULTISPECIES: hypothetical protein [Cyanophyceae]|uniref:hypothetical protein n=1 Tax=Cyanophyceae TaxID=3028117 RepID=UPI001687D171|nr:hypothetical protein [Trichocoleus sp. FACHB-832]MBD1905450.1 hypothetical protein [Trichocoleus sp. FACHB-832]
MFAQQARIVLTVTDAEPVFESVAVVQGSSHTSFLLLPVAELCLFAYRFPAAEAALFQSA